MKILNPFIISGYVSPDYFCNRVEETKAIISAYENNRNLTLYSPRRMGKTSLIEHVFHTLRKKGNKNLIYLDVYATTKLSEFINMFGKIVFSQLSGKKNIIDVVSKSLKSVSPAIVFDRLTGEPSLQFNFKNKVEEEETLEDIFLFLNSKNTKIMIAIDEFQQIQKYPQNNVEALLRSYINKSPNLSFVFSGSEKHLLLSMFSDKNRPFYQSTEFLHLEKINENVYANFIKNKFSSANIKIDDRIISSIFKWTCGYTFQTQFVCNKLYELKHRHLTDEVLKNVFDEILKSNDNIYLHYRNLITDFQWKTLRAIAKEGEARMVTSNEFIKKYDLSATSSVQTAINALIKKDFISYEDGKYFISDIFFYRWLERL